MSNATRTDLDTAIDLVEAAFPATAPVLEVARHTLGPAHRLGKNIGDYLYPGVHQLVYGRPPDTRAAPMHTHELVDVNIRYDTSPAHSDALFRTSDYPFWVISICVY